MIGRHMAEVFAWRIHLRFFGPVQDKTGVKETVMSVVEGTTVNDIIGRLQLNSWMGGQLKTAIDGRIAGRDETLHDGAELAFLPPVSGG
ncbi:MAG TPA: MoaD/ThiS family protein [Candidatus Poseidoniales archaeon]|nr:MAG TPA: MoaD/ThiS family protein [Candidatus Poseidoniales archaeon]